MGGSHFPHPTSSQAGLARMGNRQNINCHGHSQPIPGSSTYKSWEVPILHLPLHPCTEKPLISHTHRSNDINSKNLYIRLHFMYQSSGVVASGSGMYSGPSSSQFSGLTASGSGILAGASSSQSSGFVASGSGILMI